MESMSRRHAKVSPNSIQAGGENTLAHRFTANVNSRPTKVLVTQIVQLESIFLQQSGSFVTE